MDKTGNAELCDKVIELTKQGHDTAPLPVPQLFLTKPPGFDIETFLKTCHNKQAAKMESLLSRMKVPQHLARAKAAPTETLKVLNGLHFAVCDKGSSLQQSPWYAGEACDDIQMPSLTIFNLNTRLYFADYWSYYGRDYVKLVVCSKGSEAEEFCKQNLCKLDPYDNPFLFRKRVLFPEASVQVFATANVNVHILYSDSEDVKPLTFFCSENLFFSKVQVANAQV